jgi:hypothetical protein
LDINAAIQNGQFDMNSYSGQDGPGAECKAVARYIKSRHLQKVDRVTLKCVYLLVCFLIIYSHTSFFFLATTSKCFMLGGGLKGGEIMGENPEHLSEKSDYWVRRGRMVSCICFNNY